MFAEIEHGVIHPGLTSQVTRTDGQMKRLGFELLYRFPERRVRAAFNRLHSRLRKTRDLLMLQRSILTGEVFACATDWIDDQMTHFTRTAAEAAGLETVQRASLVIRFRRINEKDRMRIRQEYSFEDSPPPWQAIAGRREPQSEPADNRE